MKNLKKKLLLTHSSRPQGNLKQPFFVLTQSQKSLSAYTVQCTNKDKMSRIEPIVKNK
jgi:hypothetical protein